MAAFSFSPIALLCWAAQTFAVAATTFPATVEVDLIFPQNDTYELTPLFPVIFAYQNAALAPSLGTAIGMTFWFTIGNKTKGISPSFDLRSTNFSASDTVFVYTHIRDLNMNLTDDGPVSLNLSWETSAGNCSYQNGRQEYGGGFVNPDGVYFTLQRGGQQPDFVAATSGSRCRDIPHAAFNLTGTQHVRGSRLERDTCAVFSDVQPRVEGDPCKVQISPAAAASITADLTAAECAQRSPRVSCKPKSAASGKKQRRVAEIGLLAAFVAIWSL